MQEIPWERFTHLVIFAAYPDEQANLVSDEVDRFIVPLSKLAREKGKAILLSIGGAGDASKAFRIIAGDKKLRAKFVASVADYVTRYQLDGVDIDWEYWTYQNEKGVAGNDPVESKNLVALLADIRDKLSPDKLLTADVITGPWLGGQYLPEIQRHVNYVNLMAFDFTGEWQDSSVGHHADFSAFKKALANVLAQGFDVENVLVGLPSYGKEFLNGASAKVNNISYVDMVERLGGDMNLLEQGQFGNIYFETRGNVRRKVNYLIQLGFSGVTFFELTADHQDRRYSLLESASKLLNPHACYTKSLDFAGG